MRSLALLPVPCFPEISGTNRKVRNIRSECPTPHISRPFVRVFNRNEAKTVPVLRRCHYEKVPTSQSKRNGVVGNGTPIPHPYGRDIVFEREYYINHLGSATAPHSLVRTHGRKD
jgi:hypothetical protein